MMSSEEIISEVYCRAFDIGMYDFVEGFNNPHELTAIPTAEKLMEEFDVLECEAKTLLEVYDDGLDAGWDEGKDTEMPVTDFVYDEESPYFDDV